MLSTVTLLFIYQCVLTKDKKYFASPSSTNRECSLKTLVYVTVALRKVVPVAESVSFHSSLTASY